MANIVELRNMSNEQLETMLEEAHEEMFNLRFQHAATRLENTSRVKDVRREFAQIKTVLAQREQVIAEASSHPEIAKVLDGKEWTGNATYVYEDEGWSVSFDAGGKEVASAKVNLNKKKPKTRKQRMAAGPVRLVTDYNVN